MAVEYRNLNCDPGRLDGPIADINEGAKKLSASIRSIGNKVRSAHIGDSGIHLTNGLEVYRVKEGLKEVYRAPDYEQMDDFPYPFSVQTGKVVKEKAEELGLSTEHSAVLTRVFFNNGELEKAEATAYFFDDSGKYMAVTATGENSIDAMENCYGDTSKPLTPQLHELKRVQRGVELLGKDFGLAK